MLALYQLCLKPVSDCEAGGQDGYSELLVFQTKDALDKFKSGDFAISGSVSAVAATAGAYRRR